MTTATALPKALRHERDREVTYIWRSPNIDITQDHSGDKWGEQIELEFDHNNKRKQYRLQKDSAATQWDRNHVGETGGSPRSTCDPLWLPKSL